MQNYTRFKVVSLDQVLPLIEKHLSKKEKIKEEIDGMSANVSSLRLKCFFVHGTSCSSCGLDASFFAFETNSATNPHLNMYGVKDGQEVLFTQDHTLARSLGGKDHISNLTTMCNPCNAAKGAVELELKKSFSKNKI